MSNAVAIRNEGQQAGSALIPETFTQAMELAKVMSQAKLVPQHLQGHPADCLLIIEQASRWGISPFSAAQATSVVRGRLMFEGKLVAAVVNGCNKLESNLSYDYEGQGDNKTVTVSGKIKGEKVWRSVKVRLGDAKTDNGQWKNQPEQMLSYHGARVWARRHVPEILLGVYVKEEFDEAIDVTPPAVPAPTRAQFIEAKAEPVINEATAPVPDLDGEFKAVMAEDKPEPVSEAKPIDTAKINDLYVRPVNNGGLIDWADFCRRYKAKAKEARSIDELQELIHINEEQLRRLEQDNAKYHKVLLNDVKIIELDLLEKEQGDLV